MIQKAAGGVTANVEALNLKQLDKGKRRDNSSIRPSYKSVKYKGRKTPVDLKRSGDFHKSIRAKAEKKELIIGSDHTVDGWSSDNYATMADWLEDKYSGESSIYGISDKVFKKLLLPGLVKEMKSELQG